jgi:hypothetical protein
LRRGRHVRTLRRLPSTLLLLLLPEGRWRDDDGQRVQVATPSPCFSSCKMEPKEALKIMHIFRVDGVFSVV